ncbi:hypothetical protein FIBSPDRAFT_887668 [Athelia psychrophila]|uniref:Uncharacterized protein n=1 Tax=Athelia psychrophila TaxID=1759441 RepID=A0A166PDZ5_9AGAM|nr:hypothetical protein FIBSPDRAFT_887668 [Fibularhizoctonia sp. CBS 109695]
MPEVHFPSLRHLILLQVTIAVPDFGILSQFPSIQRLTCQAATRSDQGCQVGIVEVLAALRPGLHEDEDTGHRIPCPQLHTVAVSAAYRPLDVLALKAQISTLRDNGIPIRKVMLPESSLTQPEDDLEAIAELRKFVEIEDFQIDWPTPFANERFTKLSEACFTTKYSPRSKYSSVFSEICTVGNLAGAKGSGVLKPELRMVQYAGTGNAAKFGIRWRSCSKMVTFCTSFHTHRST